MTLKRNKSFFGFISLVTLACLNLNLSCGSKSSVEDNETGTDKSKPDPKTRLVGGQPTTQSCRLPLELGTVVDPKRPGLTQTVLTSGINPQCINNRDLKINIRSQKKITLVGQFTCRSGTQQQEQICTGSAADVLSGQKSGITIPVMIEEPLKDSEFEAWVELI